MTVALAANALVSLEEGAAALGLNALDPPSADVTTRLINQASQLAETTYCFRPLAKRTITNLRVMGPKGRKLYPPAWPIDRGGTITVTVDGQTQTVWKGEGDGDPAGFDVLAFDAFFARQAGSWAPCGAIAENTVLSYGGGYEPAPEDLREAVLELVQKLYGPMVNRTPDIASLASGGTSVQTLDGGFAASIPTYALSKRTRDVFEAYRAWRIG